MKAGARVVGVAESYDGRSDGGTGGRSTLAAAVVRGDRVVDGFSFGSCRVGGTDGTRAVVGLLDRLDRADLRAILVAGIAPAWYNLIDLATVHDATGLPVVSVSFEASPGLEPALRRAFDGTALEERLETYRGQPDRERLVVNSESLFVRSVGLPDDGAAEVVRGHTPEGGRPEPLRVARLAARAADRIRSDS